jgi:hypothetical protein
MVSSSSVQQDMSSSDHKPVSSSSGTMTSITMNAIEKCIVLRRIPQRLLGSQSAFDETIELLRALNRMQFRAPLKRPEITGPDLCEQMYRRSSEEIQPSKS